jgi:hypothetical protein
MERNYVKEFNLEENVTSLSDSKLLKEHGIFGDSGVEPDGYWAIMNDCRYDTGVEKEITGKHEFIETDYKSDLYYQEETGILEYSSGGFLYEYSEQYVQVYKAYRLDRLMAKLPEWCFHDKSRSIDWNKIEDSIPHLLHEVRSNRGQQAISACCQLLVLLAAERSEDKKEGVE